MEALYKIYQIDEENPEASKLLFNKYEINKDFINPYMYKQVYEGTVEISDIAEKSDEKEYYLPILENLYMKFNTRHPEDFKGHSLSVSDVISIDDEYFYVDSFSYIHVDWSDMSMISEI